MASSTKTVRVELTGDPSSLERSLTVVSEKSAQTASSMEGHAKKIGGAFRGLDNLLSQFGIPFTGALSTIGGKLDELGTKGSSAFQKLSHAGGLALVGVAAAAVGIGIEGVHLADQFESAHARLQGAIKNTGGSFKEYATRIDAVDKRLEQLGFNNTETEGSLSLLTRASGDTGKALGLMGLAADIARARHLSLEQGVTLLSKVVTGHVALLGRYGIATKDAAGHTLTAAQAVDALQAKFGGQAQQSAETFQGKLKTLTAQLEDIGIKIGTFLIPILEAMVGAISDAVGWFEKHKTVAIALGAILGGALVIAIAAYIASMIAAAAATIAATWPILAIIAAIAAVVAAAYFLWTNWQTVWNFIKDNPAIAAVVAILAAPVAAFVAIVIGLHWLYDNWSSIWSAIVSFTSAVWNGILAPVFGAIVAACGFLAGAAQTLWAIWSSIWSGISGATSSAWGVLSGIFGAIVGAISGVIGAAQTLWGIWTSTIGALAGVAEGVAGGIVGAFNGVIGVLHSIAGAAHDAAHAISKVADAVSSIPGAGAIRNAIGEVGDLLGFAEGGTVPGPVGAAQLAVVHGGEYVVPAGGALVSGSGGGGGDVNIYVAGNVLTERQLVDVVKDGLAAAQRRGARMPWS